MNLQKTELRSVSCPASLDTATHAETLFQLGQAVAENPGGALVPILPPFHAAVMGTEDKWEKNRLACEALQDLFGQVPFLKELAKIPGNFAEQFPTKKEEIKRLAIRVLNQDKAAPYEVLQKHKKIVAKALTEENIWSDLVDKFIRELDDGRKSKEKDDSEVTNPVSFFLKISFGRLKKYLTSTNLFYVMAVNGLFNHYSTSRPLAKTLIIHNIRNFMKAVVEKSNSTEKYKEEREAFAQMMYEIVDQFLLEAKYMLVYRECLTAIIEKVHGDDVPDHELKKTFLKGIDCLLEDIAQNKKIMNGVQVGMSRLDYLIQKKE